MTYLYVEPHPLRKKESFVCILFLLKHEKSTDFRCFFAFLEIMGVVRNGSDGIARSLPA